MFFHDDSGFAFPISRIREIGSEQENSSGQFKRRFHVVTMDDGDTCEISFRERDRICSESGNIIAAQPDCFIVHLTAPDYKPYKSQIIGWLLSSDQGVLPLTPSGIKDGVMNEVVIEMPDGQIRVCDDTYENLENYIDVLRSRMR
jgi:hypothetical protein